MRSAGPAALHRGAGRRGSGGDGAGRRGGRLAAEPGRASRPTRCPSRRARLLRAGRARTRADDYRDGQRWLAIAGLAIEGARAGRRSRSGAPRRCARALERLAARPVLGAAAAGAGVSLLTRGRRRCRPSLDRPRARGRRRALDPVAGLVALGRGRGRRRSRDADRRRRRGAADRARPPLPRAAGGSRRSAIVAGSPSSSSGSRRSSWRRSSTSSSRCPRRAGRARSVLELGRRAGVDIGEVYRVDASRRVDRAERLRRRDRLDQAGRALRQPARARPIARSCARSSPTSSATSPTTTSRAGSLFVAIVAPLGLLFARELALALARRSGADPATPAALPAYLLAIALAAFVLNDSRQPALARGRGERRRVRARAHRTIPEALIDLQRQLARTNLSDPDPPALAAAACSAPTRRRSTGSARRSPTERAD